MRRWMLFVPLALFLLLALFLFKGLFLQKDLLPSALLDRPFPEFSLPTVKDPEQSRTLADLKGQVALVNVWATWCATCRVEHPFLNRLAAEEGIAIYGINYKDDQVEARRWLAQLHDPYRWSVNDAEGRLGLDLGVYGAPETYVIDAAGVIRYKHVGELNETVWIEQIAPLVRQLEQEAADDA